MDIFIKVIQLIMSLSLLVILHEFGHFFFARLFKTRVEKFYLFFNPWFTLFKFKKGDTEYGIGWLPLGGYVKISGMIDESMDKAAMALPPKPYEFRSKPTWQRLLIMVGGVLVNFILALFIFWMITYTWGESYVSVQSAKFGLYYNDAVKELGVKDGDIVLKVGNEPIVTSQDIAKQLLYADATQMELLRGEELITVEVPSGFEQKLLAAGDDFLAEIRLPTVVDKVLPDSPAAKAGLLPGDSIVSINGEESAFFNDFTKLIVNHKNETIQLGIYRADSLQTLDVAVSDEGKLGFYNRFDTSYFEVSRMQYGFWEALPVGVDKGFSILVSYIKGMKLIFTKEGAKQMGGFGTITNLFPTTWNWQAFWFNTGLLSLILAFMNILPIPALDGGHVLFLLYEMVTGRKPADKFLEYATMAGMILLLGLLVFANGNDVFRAFGK